MTKKQIWILFVLYLLILLRVIVFKYPYAVLREIAAGWRKDVLWEGLYGANFELFRTIRMYIVHWNDKYLNSFGNLVGNIVAFIPLGCFFPLLFKVAKNGFFCLLLSFLFVFCIELFQLLSAFGVFDVDDILLNCLGAFLGWCLYGTAKRIQRRKSENVE